jgi:hypothetical protein
MKLQADASLTIKQRLEIQQLYASGQRVKAVPTRYAVHETTVRRWIKCTSPLDRSCAPHRCHRVVTDAYRNAVIAYRQAHPYAGPIRIAQALAHDYPQAHRGTVLRILQAAGLTRPPPKKDA